MKTKRNIREQNPLCLAVVHNDMESFNQLISEGADIDGLDYYGVTPLYYAADWGRVEMARVLIEHGANLEARDEYGNTPLMRACTRLHEYGAEMIALLISAGADLDATNNYGHNPRECPHYVLDFPDFETIMKEYSNPK